MGKLTITEALAEIKTIGARAQKKRDGVAKYIVRDSRIRDPFAAEGGSEQWIRQERQGLKDLAKRHILIRTEIQKANLRTPMSVQIRSLADTVQAMRSTLNAQAALSQWQSHITCRGLSALERGVAYPCIHDPQAP